MDTPSGQGLCNEGRSQSCKTRGGGGQPTQALGLSPQLKKLNAKDEVMPTSKTAKTASRNRIDDSIRRVF